MSTPVGSSTRPAEKSQAFSFNFDFRPTSSDVAYRSPSRVGQSDDSKAESPNRGHWADQKTTTTTFPSSNRPTSITSKQPVISQTPMANNSDTQELAAHLALLKTAQGRQDHHELSGTLIFKMPVLKNSKHLFSQYGFIAGMSDILEHNATNDSVLSAGDQTDPRLFFNISAPSSAFICGSQGSGKLFLCNRLRNSHNLLIKH